MHLKMSLFNTRLFPVPLINIFVYISVYCLCYNPVRICSLNAVCLRSSKTRIIKCTLLIFGLHSDMFFVLIKTLAGNDFELR